MDFLEKIIQIPFRLPGMDQKCMTTFLEGQIEVMEKEEEPLESVESAASNTLATESASAPAQEQEEQQQSRSEETSTEVDDEALPADKVALTHEEKKMVDQTLQLFRVGPRCVKRVVNVFKILMVIWKRDRDRFEADFELKRATLFLMLMASEESTREVTYKIFNWMEMGMVTYHHVCCDDANKPNNLAELFKRELKDWDGTFKLAFRGDDGGDETAKPETLMAYVESYLRNYTWKNAKQWNDVSSKFILARCFSFFRLTTEEIERKENFGLRRAYPSSS